jgi:GGDEF domain-containing protein
MVVEDITERKELEAQLVHRSMHDPLTGLANRLLFQDRLWHALERGHRERTPTCVLIIDLDGFKKINDELDIRWATSCWCPSPSDCARCCGPATPRPGSAATSSASCARTRRTPRLRSSRTACGRRSPSRWSWTSSRSPGISIGIGCVPGGEDPGQVYEQVIRAADDAMYADKTARRR